MGRRLTHSRNRFPWQDTFIPLASRLAPTFTLLVDAVVILPLASARTNKFVMPGLSREIATSEMSKIDQQEIWFSSIIRCATRVGLFNERK